MTTQKDAKKAAPQSSPLPCVSELTSALEYTGFIIMDDGRLIGPFAPDIRALIVRRVNQGPAFDAIESALAAMLGAFKASQEPHECLNPTYCGKSKNPESGEVNYCSATSATQRIAERMGRAALRLAQEVR